MEQFETIYIFQNLFLAEVVKGRLLSEGIHSHILDGNIQFTIGPTITQGFRLQVKNTDVEKAKDILDKTLQES